MRTDSGPEPSLEAGPDIAFPKADSACGDIESDPDNCGGCDIHCDGGLCVDGVCSAPLPSALVSGRVTPTGLVIDDANVYWIEKGTQGPAELATQVVKCAKSGCGNAPTVVASGLWSSQTRLALSGGNLYWADVNLLLSCPTSGCPGGVTVLSTSPLSPSDIAVDATGIYVADASRGLLEFPLAPVAGGTSPTVLWPPPPAGAAPDGGIPEGGVFSEGGISDGGVAEGGAAESPTPDSSTLTLPSPALAVALDGTSVYFGTTGVSLLTCSATGCTNLVVGGTPTVIDVAGGAVYIGTQAQQSPGAIASCTEANCSAANVTLLSTRISFCAGISVDSTNIYFTDQGAYPGPSGSGRVEKCPLSGCSGNPTAIAAYVNFPQQIAVDDTNVYWTDFGTSTDPAQTKSGRVMVAAK